MRACFVSIDVESDLAKNKAFKGIENLDKILSIFKKYDIDATLFVTGNVLEKYTEKVKEWSKKHEIACHSFSHTFWNNLDNQKREQDLEKFIWLYREAFSQNPKGFRAPSHIIDEQGLKLLQDKGFLYDSSVVPHYLPLKKYRGYRGKALPEPYFPGTKNYQKKGEMNILEIPIAGLLFGIPLAGTWISKLPLFVYQVLLGIFNPEFLTFNLHSWDSLNPQLLLKIESILGILKDKNYQFLTGEQIYAAISKN